MDRFCIIGGDKRQAYLGQRLIDSGSFVTYYALEKCDSAQQDYAILDTAISKCGSVILPMPLTRDGKTVNTPLSDISLLLDKELGKLFSGKRIYTSDSEKLIKMTGLSKDLVFDYSKDEALCIANAVLTAEGALAAAINESPCSLFGSRCLVSGFGRIGKVLAKYLSAVGCDVFVSARKDTDLAWITALGYTAVNIGEIKNGAAYDFVFNTVPHTVFTRETLAGICKKDCSYIELASPPFGAEKASFDGLPVRFVQASGLPGKLSSKAAADIIYDTINKHR